MSKGGCRIFRYSYPDPGSETPVEEVWTEDEIRRLFYPQWSKKMHQVGKQSLINFENCLQDWITVHWAEEIK